MDRGQRDRRRDRSAARQRPDAAEGRYVLKAQGEVVAARIAATLDGGQPPATFAGDGASFLETGRGMAAMVTGGFLADPPAVRLTMAAREHFAAKRAFERERLAARFGG